VPISGLREAASKLLVVVGRLGGEEMVLTLRQLLFEKFNAPGRAANYDGPSTVAYLVWALVLEFAANGEAIIREFEFLSTEQKAGDWGEAVWAHLPQGEELPEWVVPLWKRFWRNTVFGPRREDASFLTKVFRQLTQAEGLEWIRHRGVSIANDELVRTLCEIIGYV
jgi:hypothetical protein